MNDLEQRVRRAFDDVVLPQEVRAAALASIDAAAQKAAAAQGASEGVSTSAAAPDHPPVPSARPAMRTKAPRIVRFRRAAIALAACMALVAVGIGGAALYRQPVAYVGIDVNPSLELGLNRFGIVVEADGVNDDGAALLQAVSLTGRPYADALAALVQSAAFQPYTQEDSFVEVSVTSDDGALSERLRAQSDECLRSLPCEGTCHTVDEETREAAFAAGMGVGRYRAAVELMELDPSVTLEECSSLTMRELRDHIDACSHDGGSDGEAAGNGQGSHKGQGQGQGSGRHQGEGGRHGGGAESQGSCPNGSDE